MQSDIALLQRVITLILNDFNELHIGIAIRFIDSAPSHFDLNAREITVACLNGNAIYAISSSPLDRAV